MSKNSKPDSSFSDNDSYSEVELQALQEKINKLKQMKMAKEESRKKIIT